MLNLKENHLKGNREIILMDCWIFGSNMETFI